MTDLCRCDWKEKIKAMWERLQTTIYGVRVNGTRLVPDGDGIVDIEASDIIEVDDQVRYNDNLVKNRAIKAEVDRLEGEIETIAEEVTDAVTSMDVSTDASTVTLTLKHLSEAVDHDSMPVASSSQAGVMNASDYAAFSQMQTDIEDLKHSTIIYPVIFDSAEPTQTEITAKFRATYPTITLIPGIKVVDYTHNLAYQYDGDLWIKQQFAGIIPIATTEIIGGVKGSTTNGQIAVNVDGTMALNGYDSIINRLDDIDGTDGRLDLIEADITTINGEIVDLTNDVQDNTEDIGTLRNNILVITQALDGKLNVSNVNHETWTFTLDDDTTVDKEVMLYVA